MNACLSFASLMVCLGINPWSAQHLGSEMRLDCSLIMVPDCVFLKRKRRKHQGLTPVRACLLATELSRAVVMVAMQMLLPICSVGGQPPSRGKVPI